jgi:hypothetical protein
MSLREVVQRWDQRSPSLLEPGLSDQPSLVATARLLAERSSGMAEIPAIETIDELASRLREAVDSRTLDCLSKRDWGRAAFALWHGDRPLAAEPQFLEPYLGRLLRKRRRRDVTLLISAYLRAFSNDRPGLALVSEVLRHLVPNWQWPWAKRHREHQLFDPEQAPGALMDACLGSDEPHAVQTELGLAHLGSEGLVLAAQLQGLGEPERALAAGRVAHLRLERQLAWAVGEVGIAPRLCGPLADALLRPWLDRPVPEQLKQGLQDFRRRSSSTCRQKAPLISPTSSFVRGSGHRPGSRSRAHARADGCRSGAVGPFACLGTCSRLSRPSTPSTASTRRTTRSAGGAGPSSKSACRNRPHRRSRRTPTSEASGSCTAIQLLERRRQPDRLRLALGRTQLLADQVLLDLEDGDQRVGHFRRIDDGRDGPLFAEAALPCLKPMAVGDQAGDGSPPRRGPRLGGESGRPVSAR